MGSLYSQANKPSVSTDANDKTVIAEFLARQREQVAEIATGDGNLRREAFKLANADCKALGGNHTGDILTCIECNSNGSSTVTPNPTETDMSLESIENEMNDANPVDETATKKTRKKAEPVVKPLPTTSLNLVALKGAQADVSYFVANMTVGDVVDRLHIVSGSEYKEQSPEDRYQRQLNTARVKQGLVPYISAPDHYIPPIVAYLDNGHFNFQPTDGVPSVGNLTLQGNVTFDVGDGQHRVYGYGLAVEADPDNTDLLTEDVTVVFVTGLTTDQKQQLFSDLNRNAKLPPKAIGILFDHRDIPSIVSRMVADSGAFAGKVKMDSNVLSKKADEIVTLGVVYEMVKSLIYTNPDAKGEKNLKETFKNSSPEEMADWVSSTLINTILKNLPSSELIIRGTKGAAAINRDAYLCYSSLGWQAIARATGEALNWSDLETIGAGIKGIDWSITSPIWRTVVQNDKVVTRKNTINDATRIVIDLMIPKKR